MNSEFFRTYNNNIKISFSFYQNNSKGLNFLRHTWKEFATNRLRNTGLIYQTLFLNSVFFLRNAFLHITSIWSKSVAGNICLSCKCLAFEEAKFLVYFIDLRKQNFLMVVKFNFKPIFAFARSTSVHYKNSEKWLEIIQLTTLILIWETRCRSIVFQSCLSLFSWSVKHLIFITYIKGSQTYTWLHHNGSFTWCFI